MRPRISIWGSVHLSFRRSFRRSFCRSHGFLTPISSENDWESQGMDWKLSSKSPAKNMEKSLEKICNIPAKNLQQTTYSGKYLSASSFEASSFDNLNNENTISKVINEE